MRVTKISWSAAVVLAAALSPRSAAAGPVPSGAHPRLFMSAQQISGYTANAAISGTAAAALVAACQDTIDNPNDYVTRGGSDGDAWPGSAVKCAFAYRATQKAAFLTQAIKYWQAALDDDQTMSPPDKLGCVAGVDTNWQSWDGNPPAPPVILTVTHDTGYPMRWYGPDIALTYDWLYSAPGVDAALLSQTRTCLTAWLDYYTKNGYHADQAGANYNAGYVAGKTLGAIAIGNDGGADGHLWTDTTQTLFPKLLVGQGLLGAKGKVGMPAGVLVGGDWAEGWQYGPLSVLEYAVAAKALEDQGESEPEMDAWTDSLAIRYIHGTLPDLSGQWVGGDFDDTAVYTSPNENELDAVLAGPSSDESAAFAAFMKKKQALTSGGFIYNAFAELRKVTPVDYTAQKSEPARWYLARGTRAVYARTSWDKDALWTVFTSAPSVVSDHEHYSASNFVVSRGSDALIVDPSNYGEVDSLATNAVTVDSTVDPGDYEWTQTPWSKAELDWARGTDDAVYAARSDFAKAFIFTSTPSDVQYAHREWVMLPEGEIVTIDRAHTADAGHGMSVRFHANTGGGHLALNGSIATGDVGASTVAIHEVFVSGGTPAVTQPEVGDCSVSCSFPCGECDAARFPVDEFAIKVPGPWAVAVHVIDALAKGTSPSTVTTLDDDSVDPGQKDNAGVLGAAVRSGKTQSYVVASSAVDGASPVTMRYGVPGDGASRHVVFDAPEDANGESIVKTSVKSGRCEITIEKGKGFAGRPLMFTVESASGACKATESTDVPPNSGTGGGGSSGTSTASNGAGGEGAGGSGAGAGAGMNGSGGGCGCRFDGSAESGAGAAFVLALVVALDRRRRARSRRALNRSKRSSARRR